MRNLILAASIVLCSTNAIADNKVDAFLTAYSTMDKSGYQILSDYREQVNLTCKRDVTIEEIEAFQKSREYATLSALVTVAGRNITDYKNILQSLVCN